MILNGLVSDTFHSGPLNTKFILRTFQATSFRVSKRFFISQVNLSPGNSIRVSFTLDPRSLYNQVSMVSPVNIVEISTFSLQLYL